MHIFEFSVGNEDIRDGLRMHYSMTNSYCLAESVPPSTCDRQVKTGSAGLGENLKRETNVGQKREFRGYGLDSSRGVECVPFLLN